MTDEQIKEPQQEGQQVEAPEEGLPTLKEVLIEQAIEAFGIGAFFVGYRVVSIHPVYGFFG